MDVVTGWPTEVIDGDTFDVQIGWRRWNNIYGYAPNERVRIRSIDAPELPSTAGIRARWDLVQRLNGKYVELYIHSRDTFGRLVADVRTRPPQRALN